MSWKNSIILVPTPLFSTVFLILICGVSSVLAIVNVSAATLSPKSKFPLTVKLPSITVFPVTSKSVPTYNFLAMPTPPSIITDPVVELDASVVSLTTRVPSISVLPLVAVTLNLPPMSKLPPTYSFLAIPAPPSTINDPVDVLLASVVKFAFNVLSAFSAPLTFNTPVTSTSSSIAIAVVRVLFLCTWNSSLPSLLAVAISAIVDFIAPYVCKVAIGPALSLLLKLIVPTPSAFATLLVFLIMSKV